MAWTTPKTWVAGSQLTAADMNTYVSANDADLDLRTVKVFADASARTTGIPSPTDGMVTYLTGTDSLEVYDGSAWTAVAVGSDPGVLQVVSTAKTDTFSTTSTSFTDVTGLTVSITPSSATNKVLIIAQVALGSSANGTSLRLSGGNATNYVGAAAGSRIQAIIGGSGMAINQFQDAMTLAYLDSPATTSSTTYAVQLRVNSGTAYVNQSPTDVNSADYARGASSITVLEVKA